MNKIIAVTQKYLCGPRLDTVLSGMDPLDRRMLSYFCKMSRDNFASQTGLLSRTGKNIFPFTQDVLQMTDTVMPVYDPDFDLTWEEVTDQRAHELEQRMLNENKKLVVLWSGGIDSTCIMAAILKNFQPANRSRVTVACTIHSAIENPVFYVRHIVPHFTVIDYNQFINNSLTTVTDTLVVDGFAGDLLHMSMTPSLDVCMAVRQGEMLAYDWRTQPDPLINYLGQVTDSVEFATWYYDRNKANIESVDVPVETYFDFMWWIGFNCEWYSWGLHAWFFCYRHLNIPYQECKSKSVGWFRTDSYQQWAMNNNGANVKHGLDLGSLKLWPKKYIYDVDHNEDYRRYKTKINSTGRDYNDLWNLPFAVTDDFKLLYLDHDLEQIIKFLPTHITS